MEILINVILREEAPLSFNDIAKKVSDIDAYFSSGDAWLVELQNMLDKMQSAGKITQDSDDGKYSLS